MTYQNLLNEFIKTDKRFLEYEQGNHFVRLVKIQLKPGVYALYATITYCGKDPSYNRYHFNPRDAMELVGYIDHNGDLRFPTRHFSGIIEDAENGPQHENKKNVLESILQKEAKKMALATPLPSISDGKDEVLHTAYEKRCDGYSEARPTAKSTPSATLTNMFTIPIVWLIIWPAHLAGTRKSSRNGRKTTWSGAGKLLRNTVPEKRLPRWKNSAKVLHTLNW